jgi:hypothetical protein
MTGTKSPFLRYAFPQRDPVVVDGFTTCHDFFFFERPTNHQAYIFLKGCVKFVNPSVCMGQQGKATDRGE